MKREIPDQTFMRNAFVVIWKSKDTCETGNPRSNVHAECFCRDLEI